MDNMNEQDFPESKKPQKKRGPKKVDNRDFTPGAVLRDAINDADDILTRPARRPTLVEQKIREELLKDELRKIVGNRSRYFIISGVINILNVSSYRNISIECKDGFFTHAQIKNLFGNPETFAILNIMEIDKDDFDIFNSEINFQVNNKIGLI